MLVCALRLAKRYYRVVPPETRYVSVGAAGVGDVTGASVPAGEREKTRGSVEEKEGFLKKEAY